MTQALAFSMECQGFAFEGERAAKVTGTRQRIPLPAFGICLGRVSVRAAGIHVGDDAFNVQLDNGGFAFIAEKELQRFPAVHES